MNQPVKKQIYPDLISFMSIGLFSLGYSIYFSNFAEMHIQFSFLDFPIFVGEMLVFLCFCLFIKKNNCPLKSLKTKHWIVIAYFTFVIIKAVYGYYQFGPLAFRNAALFYYPIFIIFSYSCRRTEFFSSKTIIFYFSIIILMFASLKFNIYWTFTYLSLGLALVCVQPYKKFKYWMIVVLILVTPYKYLFATSRMMIISNVLCAAFLIVSFCYILRVKRVVKVAVSILGIILVIGGITQISDKNSIKSIVKVGRIFEIFKALDIHSKINPLSEYLMVPRSEPRIYSPNPFPSPSNPIKQESDIGSMVAETSKRLSLREEKLKIAIEQIYLPEEIAAQKEGALSRHLGVAYNNAVFRLFIWRDMLVELGEEKPLLGFDFGKPILPKSFLAMGWAAVQIKQDGWVAAHNSYLHIIYRAGFVGLAAIIFIFVILFQMIKKSIQYRSKAGILLCGCIINWFVAANFLLIFELPYTAVPLWFIFGMSYAYINQLQETSASADKI